MVNVLNFAYFNYKNFFVEATYDLSNCGYF